MSWPRAQDIFDEPPLEAEAAALEEAAAPADELALFQQMMDPPPFHLTGAELAKAVTRETGMKLKDVKRVMKGMEEVIKREMPQREKITIAGAVVLKTERKAATKASNRMMFGRPIKVAAKPAKVVVKAFPVKAIRDVVLQQCAV